LKQSKAFWANVRTISEKAGYTARKTGQVKAPTVEEVIAALRDSGLSADHIVAPDSMELTPFGATLMDYFIYRGAVLNTYAEPRLMDVERARAVFEKLRETWPPTRKILMNKQKEEKANYAYFTAIINMLIEVNLDGLPCNFDPQQLTTATRDDAPLRTFSRRLDGAFPNTVNPIAIWEVKEYYYTTTFGSRIADGVYETLLDGMEIEELQEHEGITVRHYLMVDSHYTWWVSGGRSYLCRMIDMLHMGYVDEVLFGYEVVERLPEIVSGWVQQARQNPEHLGARKGQTPRSPGI
jgi:hypothetical protein